VTKIRSSDTSNMDDARGKGGGGGGGLGGGGLGGGLPGGFKIPGVGGGGGLPGGAMAGGGIMGVLVLLAAMWWLTPGIVAAICGPLYGAAP